MSSCRKVKWQLFCRKVTWQLFCQAMWLIIFFLLFSFFNFFMDYVSGPWDMKQFLMFMTDRMPQILWNISLCWSLFNMFDICSGRYDTLVWSHPKGATPILEGGRELLSNWLSFLTFSNPVVSPFYTSTYWSLFLHEKNGLFLSHLVSEIVGSKVGLTFQC